MAKGRSQKQSAEVFPKIYRAVLGELGRVHRSTELTREEAIAARKAGRDVVVSGGKPEDTRRLAREIEIAANGFPPLAEGPHGGDDEFYLYHFHANQQRVPSGHCFYETHKRRAFA